MLSVLLKEFNDNLTFSNFLKIFLDFMKRKSFYEKRKNSCIDLNTVNDEIKSFLSCKIDELNFNPVMVFFF